ncbi:MAG: ATP synthase F0 subunit B [Anaerolineae bacterium]|nr:MAG: ATP synthase F0 subunit B [Anaerolineae bacterium]
MEALGINLGYFFVQVFNFFILLTVLHAWVYKPILTLLETRREKIAQGLEDARVAAEARANAEADAQKIMADANARAAEVAREANARAEEATKDVRAAAEADAKKIREQAAVDAAAAKDGVLAEVRKDIPALVIAAAQKLVGESLDEKRQRTLIDEFFSGIKGGKVEVAAAGGDATVTSALPLTDGEKDTVKKSLKGEVTFKVDPRILGGLVVRVGDKVVDGSVAGKLDSMRQNLK